MFNLEGKGPNKIEQTGPTSGLSEIQTADTPTVPDIMHRREPVYLLSFILSACHRSNSFTILSPSPLLVNKHPQKVQATLDRSRISNCS